MWLWAEWHVVLHVTISETDEKSISSEMEQDWIVSNLTKLLNAFQDKTYRIMFATKYPLRLQENTKACLVFNFPLFIVWFVLLI